MKKSGSVYILALICIGSVCTEFNPEYRYLTAEPGRSQTEKLTPEEILNATLKSQSIYELPKTGMIDKTTENKIFGQNNYVNDISALQTTTKWPPTLFEQKKSKYGDQQRRAMSRDFKRLTDVSPLIQTTRVRKKRTIDHRFEEKYNGNGREEQPVGFCNYSYNSIDAAMRVNGIDFVFVDKGEVIDVRIEFKMAIHLVFPGGPKWVQAAVYSKRNQEAYLFQDDKIWGFAYVNGAFDLTKRFRNSNKHSYSPECAFQYFSSNMLYLLKNKHFFKFEPYFPSDPVRRGTRTLEMFSTDRKIDAAISSGDDVNFIVKDKVYRIGNSTQIKTSQVFSKCLKY